MNNRVQPKYNNHPVDPLILRCFGALLIIGGVTHWLIIFGVLAEKTPLWLTFYFHSLAVLSPLAGIGLWLARSWGIKIAVFICLTQMPAHLYMIYLDAFAAWNSGYSIPLRLLDLALVAIGLAYLSFRKRLSTR